MGTRVSGPGSVIGRRGSGAMSRARYRHDGAGGSMRTVGFGAVRVMALVSVVALSAVACGNRRSSDKLNALLNGNNGGQGAAPPPAPPTPAATPDAGSAAGAGAPAPDAAATPGVGGAS